VKKRIILISVILLCLIVQAQIVYHQNNSLINYNRQLPDTVWAGVYKPIVNGGANLGSGGAPCRDIFFFGQQLRIRQNGIISKVVLYCADTAGLTGVYIKIWRKNGNKFDLIGKSNNIINGLKSGEISEAVLTNPIYGVREGDYYSIFIENGNLNFYGTNDADVCTYYTNEDATGTYDWYNAPNRAWGYNIVVRMFIPAPDIVFFGNSILSGYYKNKSFLEKDTSRNDITSTIPYKVIQNLSAYFSTKFEYQNMSVGGQLTSDLKKRIGTDVVDIKPEMVVIEGGINDIINKIPSSVIISNFSDMLDSCSLHGIKACVVLIQPMTVVSDRDMLKRDSINSRLQQLCIAKNHIYVDIGNNIGVSRISGKLWNLNPIYSAGEGLGIHLNQAGTIVYSTEVADKLKEWMLTGMTSYEDPQPKQFRLYNNFPNPFNPYTTIKFDVASSGRIKLQVFDITGRLVEELTDVFLEQGTYLYSWNGTGYSSGVYIYKASDGKNILTGKMILAK